MGGVKGHEQKAMQSVQDHLQKNKIALSVNLQPSQERLAVTVLFHRVKLVCPLMNYSPSSQQVMLASCCIVDLYQLIIPWCSRCCTASNQLKHLSYVLQMIYKVNVI